MGNIFSRRPQGQPTASPDDGQTSNQSPSPNPAGPNDLNDGDGERRHVQLIISQQRRIAQQRAVTAAMIAGLDEDGAELGSIIRDAICQALADLPRTLTNQTTNAQALDRIRDMALDSEKKWCRIVEEMVCSIPLNHPLAPVMTSLCFLEMCLPSHRSVRDVGHRLLTKVQNRDLTSPVATKEIRNVMSIWTMLSEKLPGRPSEIFMGEFDTHDDKRKYSSALHFLVGILSSENSSYLNSEILVLHALLALERFAQTRKCKDLILSQDIQPILQDLEKNYYCFASGSSTTRETRTSAMVKAEIGFVASWSLDNVFGRATGDSYAHEKADLSHVNVMLDVKDATKNLKLSADGLEARNDSSSFESVRTTAFARGGGVWYYEVKMFTSGIGQIGWCTKSCRYQEEEGFGIGDDRHSFAYDGQRQLIWHDAKYRSIAGLHRNWKRGDVIGMFIDLDVGDRKSVV